MRRCALLLAAIVIAFDQITKLLVSQYFVLGETLNILPGFDLTLRHNHGAGFSFLADGSGWQRWFLIALALIITVIIFVWLGKVTIQQKLEGFGLALIMGGALGNLWDRLIHGYVVDFLLFYYQEWQWPAFNIADTAICIGAFLFAISIFIQKESSENSKKLNSL